MAFKVDIWQLFKHTSYFYRKLILYFVISFFFEPYYFKTYLPNKRGMNQVSRFKMNRNSIWF